MYPLGDTQAQLQTAQASLKRDRDTIQTLQSQQNCQTKPKTTNTALIEQLQAEARQLHQDRAVVDALNSEIQAIKSRNVDLHNQYEQKERDLERLRRGMSTSTDNDLGLSSDILRASSSRSPTVDLLAASSSLPSTLAAPSYTPAITTTSIKTGDDIQRYAPAITSRLQGLDNDRKLFTNERDRFYDTLESNLRSAVTSNVFDGIEYYRHAHNSILGRIKSLNEAFNGYDMYLPDWADKEKSKLLHFDNLADTLMARSSMKLQNELKAIRRELGRSKSYDTLFTSRTSKRVAQKTASELRRADSSSNSDEKSTGLSSRFRQELLNENSDRRQWKWYDDPNLPTFALGMGIVIAGIIASVSGILSNRTIINDKNYSKKEKDKAGTMNMVFIVALLISVASLLGIPVIYGVYRHNQNNNNNNSSDD